MDTVEARHGDVEHDDISCPGISMGGVHRFVHGLRLTQVAVAIAVSYLATQTQSLLFRNGSTSIQFKNL
jgi:hypothetical protein